MTDTLKQQEAQRGTALAPESGSASRRTLKWTKCPECGTEHFSAYPKGADCNVCNWRFIGDPYNYESNEQA